MHPRSCAECGAMVEDSVSPIPFEVRGETVVVEGIPHGACSACGEVYLSLEAAAQLQKAAIGMSKAARQLLSPEEIRDLRHSLALSQVAFEDMLGIGAKSVVRWEKGTVFQSATADRLMRLIRLRPELAGVLSSGELYAPNRSLRDRAAILEDIQAARAQIAADGGAEAKDRVLKRG